ncbi:hypothetical protein F4680DRAFT_445461 [Xylaria scruposa]|nr:hypothetical protein F4680DRAFT_445461 [Xylaria scruposa]
MTSLPPDFDPSTTSFGVPPPGSLSNFQNPPSQAWVVEVSVYITLPLMIGSFVLRLLARLRTRQLGVDDYICFAAAIVTVLFNAFILAQCA